MSMLRRAAAVAVAFSGLVAAGAASADQYQRWVDIMNLGDSAIYSVYISDIDRMDWGPDLLGNYVIPPGNDLVVEPVVNRGYCRFDVLVVYETGEQQTMYGVNLCEVVQIATNEYDHLISV
jgi:hypothetical protein